MSYNILDMIKWVLSYYELIFSSKLIWIINIESLIWVVLLFNTPDRTAELQSRLLKDVVWLCCHFFLDSIFWQLLKIQFDYCLLLFLDTWCVRGHRYNANSSWLHRIGRVLWHWGFQLSFALLRVLFELSDCVQNFFFWARQLLMRVLCCTISSSGCIWIKKFRQQIAIYAHCAEMLITW
jgi:hypothetical protein